MILLDTHVVIWLAQDYSRLTPRARAVIEQARTKDNGLAVSAITLFEIALLASRGRICLTPGLETFLPEVERRFVVFPITGYVALQAFQLPAAYPKDPADRIIGATALVEDIQLLTADHEIRNARAFPTIW